MFIEDKANSTTASNRQLILISLDWGRTKDPPLSLGHASILTHMTLSGLDVIPSSWSVADPHFKVEDVIDFIMKHAGDSRDVGLGAFVWNEPHIQRIIRTLKRRSFPGRIILGGSQVSYTKRDLETYYPEVDIFVRGYAEDALVQLFSSGQLYPSISGVHYAGRPDGGHSAVAELDAVASPYLTGILPAQPFVRWETQRGCPFRCAFCQHRESDLTRKHRYLNTQRIFDEIDFFLQNPIVQDIAVLDPVFNSGDRYLSILERLSNGGYTGKLALQCRIEMISDDFLERVVALNKTGNVVLEFGLQTIHPAEERQIQRPNNMKLVREVLTETKRRNIQTEVSLIFGLPEQTVTSFQQSINFCKSMNVGTIYAYPLRLHRGTPLYDRQKELGLVEAELHAENNTGDLIPHVVSSPSFTAEDWYEMAELAKGLDGYNAGYEPKMMKTLKHTAWADVIAAS